MSEQEKNREENIKEIQKQMQDILDSDLVKSYIEGNEITFNYKDVEYKVRKPTYKERQAINTKRIQKFNELLQAKDSNGQLLYKTESELKSIYKSRGIDIDKMDDNFEAIENKKSKLQDTLGKMIKEKKPENECKRLADEIKKLIEDQQLISIKKTNYLESAIETQILMYVYGYLAFLTTEKKQEDKWVKVWNTYEEFENSDNIFVDKVLFYVSLITRERV